MLQYEYLFNLTDDQRHRILVELDETTLELVIPEHVAPPDWTLLTHHQCLHCELDPQQHRYCPISANVAYLLELFGEVPSYAEAEVTVITRERTYYKRTDVQHGISSILGIFMVASACPAMKKLRPMVRFHLPFATLHETVFRATSMYMLSQYFLKHRQQEPDFSLEGLQAIYDKVHYTNMGMAARLREVFKEDANNNGLIVLDVYSQMMNLEIEHNLHDLEYIFEPYFS
jgi:hypothetical protein